MFVLFSKIKLCMPKEFDNSFVMFTPGGIHEAMSLHGFFQFLPDKTLTHCPQY
jgi:hypothetical protein